MSSRNPLHHRGAIVLTLSFALAICGTNARADTLDKVLLDEAPAVLKKLQDKGYHTVGILKFRVHRSGQPPTFNSGPINVSMADRLQNALLKVDDPANPVNIIDNATRVAHDQARSIKKRTFSFVSNLDDRHTLLDAEYPLVWGNKKFKPDALLTGDIGLTKDNKFADIQIRVFDTKNPKTMELLHKFRIPTDRTFLAECGQSFVVPTEVRRAVSRDSEEGTKADKAAQDSATNQNEKKDKDVASNPENPIQVTLVYDDGKEKKEFTPERDSANPGDNRYKIAQDPKETDKVAIKIKNTGDKTVGVVLGVDGKSTLLDGDLSGKNIEEFTKWILEPGDEYVIEGFYTEEKGKNLYAFRVLSEEESKSRLETDPQNKGKITLAVFFKVDNPPPPPPDGPKISEKRGLRRGLITTKTKPATLTEAQKLLQTALNGKAATRSRGVGKRGLIDLEKDLSEGKELTRVPFAHDPKPAVTMIINYYPTKAE